MARLCLSVIARVAAIFCLLSNSPASGWYKQVPSSRYYSVGRASGLLQGLRWSEYVRRGGIRERAARNLAELSDSAAERSPHPATREWDTEMALCVKEVTPQWSSCAAIADDPSIYICKADVRLTFAARTCGALSGGREGREKHAAKTA